MNPTTETPKETWVTPEIGRLDVAETEVRNMRGFDGGNFVDCSGS